MSVIVGCNLLSARYCEAGGNVAFGMVFLDESGHFSNSDFVCLAGYMARDEGWTALCAGWRVLLEMYGIPALHMREIMSPSGRSPAAVWEIDRKLDMLREFITLIRKHTEVGFGVALDARHFREIVKTIRSAWLREKDSRRSRSIARCSAWRVSFA